MLLPVCLTELYRSSSKAWRGCQWPWYGQMGDTAVQVGNIHNVRWFLERGAAVNGKRGSGPPLFTSFNRGRSKVALMLIENGANFTAAFDYWQTFHHLRKTENPFPRLWDHFVTNIEYDTPGELVSDLMTGKALGLVRKLRFDWEIPEALKSEPDPTWNGDSLERGNFVNRLQNQFVLVGEQMLNSTELHIHGTQCLSYVLECWGEKGKSILRYIAPA